LNGLMILVAQRDTLSDVLMNSVTGTDPSAVALCFTRFTPGALKKICLFNLGINKLKRADGEGKEIDK